MPVDTIPPRTMDRIKDEVSETVENIIANVPNDICTADAESIEDELFNLIDRLQKPDERKLSWFYANPVDNGKEIIEENPDGTITRSVTSRPSVTGLWNGIYKRIPKSDIAKRYEWLCLLLPHCPAYVIKNIIEDSPDNPQHITITCDDAGLLVEIG